jgi:hypothetical protein
VVTVKSSLLVAVPPAVVTLILPLLAPAGTVARIPVDDSTVNEAAAPLNLTVLAPEKLLPLIVTAVPTTPVIGSKPEMAGAGGGGGAVPVTITSSGLFVASLAW